MDVLHNAALGPATLEQYQSRNFLLQEKNAVCTSVSFCKRTSLHHCMCLHKYVFLHKCLYKAIASPAWPQCCTSLHPVLTHPYTAQPILTLPFAAVVRLSWVAPSVLGCSVPSHVLSRGKFGLQTPHVKLADSGCRVAAAWAYSRLPRN